MPLAILVVGVLLVLTGINGTTSQMFRLLKSEFVGPNSFFPWAISIGAVGSIGYIPNAKPIANGLLTLLVLVLLLQNDGFFSKFSAAVDVGLGSNDGEDIGKVGGLDLSSFASGADGLSKFMSDFAGRKMPMGTLPETTSI